MKDNTTKLLGLEDIIIKSIYEIAMESAFLPPCSASTI